MEESVNLIPFMLESISSDKYFYKSIDKEYKTNEEENLKAMKESEYYNHPLCIQGNIQQQIYYRKLIGIIENDGDLEFLIEDIKKRWKYSWTYFKNNNLIVLGDFIMYLMKKINLKKTTDEEFNSYCLAVIFFSIHYKKDMDLVNKDLYYFKTMLDQRENSFNARKFLKYNNIPKEEIKQLNSLLTEIKKVSNIQSSNFISRVEFKDQDSIKFDSIPDKNRDIFILEIIYDLTNLDLDRSIGLLTNKELIELLHMYSYGYKEKEIKLDDNLFRWFSTAIQIKQLIKLYNNAKEFIFDNYSENINVELKEAREELSKERANNNRLLSEIDSLKQELDILKRENSRIRKEVSLNESYRNENVSLRNFLFTKFEEEDIIEDISKINLEYLNSKQGVIIGGSSSWQKGLKEVLPNWKFVSANALNFDKRVIKNRIIFFNIISNNHGMYYKVINSYKNLKVILMSYNNVANTIKFINERIEG